MDVVGNRIKARSNLRLYDERKQNANIHRERIVKSQTTRYNPGYFHTVVAHSGDFSKIHSPKLPSPRVELQETGARRNGQAFKTPLRRNMEE